MKELKLTLDEANTIAKMIDDNLFNIITIEGENFSMNWLRNMVNAYDKLAEYCGRISPCIDKSVKKDGE